MGDFTNGILRQMSDTPAIDMENIRRQVDADIASGKTLLDSMQELIDVLPKKAPEYTILVPPMR